MEYVRLGNSGLKVSKICLGTMGFGTPGKLFPWCVGYETAEKIVKECLDQGINFSGTRTCKICKPLRSCDCNEMRCKHG